LNADSADTPMDYLAMDRISFRYRIGFFS